MSIFEKMFHRGELSRLRKERAQLVAQVKKLSNRMREKQAKIDSLRRRLRRFERKRAKGK